MLIFLIVLVFVLFWLILPIIFWSSARRYTNDAINELEESRIHALEHRVSELEHEVYRLKFPTS